jgi:hypothetical protein
MVHKNHILERNILEFSRSAKGRVVYFEIQTTPVIY